MNEQMTLADLQNIKTVMMQVTPEMARQWLANNHGNRNFSYENITKYAADMKSGAWKINGEGIRFRADGTLVDGQHRLKAILAANVPVWMSVTTGIPTEEATLYDRGRPRSTTNTLVMMGLDPQVVGSKGVAVAKLYLYMTTANKNLSDDQIKGFLLENAANMLTALNLTKGFSRLNMKNATVNTAVFSALKAGEDIHKLEQFVNIVRTGMYSGDKAETAAIIIRNDLISKKIYTGAGANRCSSVRKVEKAIYDFCRGYPRKITYANYNGGSYSFPEAEEKESAAGADGKAGR